MNLDLFLALEKEVAKYEKAKVKVRSSNNMKYYRPTLTMERLAFGTYPEGIMGSLTLLRKKLLVPCDMAEGWFLR